MKNTETIKIGQPSNPIVEIQNGIDKHRKAAVHFEAAAKYHLDAAKHREDGDHDKALKSTIVANGHASLAKEAQRNNVKHQTTKS